MNPAFVVRIHGLTSLMTCIFLLIAGATALAAQETKETLDNQAIVKMVQAHLSPIDPLPYGSGFSLHVNCYSRDPRFLFPDRRVRLLETPEPLTHSVAAGSVRPPQIPSFHDLEIQVSETTVIAPDREGARCGHANTREDPTALTGFPG